MGIYSLRGNAYAGAGVTSSRRWLHVLVVLAMIVTQLVFVPAPEAQAAVTGTAVENATLINAVDFIDLEVDEIQSVGNDATGGTFTLSYDGVEFTAPIRYDAPLTDANEIQTLYNDAGTNEVQNIVHDHTSGTFRVTFQAVESGDIDFDESAAQLETILESMSTITDVTVVENAQGDWDVEFVDPGDQDLAMMTISTNNLLGGSTIVVTQTTAGADGGTFTITFDGQTTGNIAYDAAAGTIEAALEGLSNITDVTVTGSGTMLAPWVITFLNPGSQDVAEITTNDGSLVGGSSVVATIVEGNLSVETALEALTDIVDVSVSWTGLTTDPWLVTFLDPGGAVPFLLTKDDSGLTGTTTILEHKAGESAPIDSAGITYLGGGEFLVSDSEINEEPTVYDGVNIWHTNNVPAFVGPRAGFELPDLKEAEPTGLAYNPFDDGHVYISNDNVDMVWDIDLGPDGDFGTADDTITSINVAPLGIADPEDVAYDPVGNQVFVGSGRGAGTILPRTITPIGLGPDRILGTGDDVLDGNLDVSWLVEDLEGLGYRAASDTLLVVDPRPSPERIFELTKDGRLIREITIGATRAPSDVTIAPASVGGGDSLYVVDRGDDNDGPEPPPRDGKWFEYQTAFANLEPFVDAGLDQTVIFGDPANLVGDSFDDGQGSGYTTPPHVPTTTWEKVSGPGLVSFADANALTTTATFTLPGTYVLELTSSDGDFSPSDTVTIEVKTVGRLWGLNRYGTAAAVADAVFPAPSVAYIAVGTNFPDALVAGSVGDGPVLLTTTNSLPDETKAALAAKAPFDEIFIVGGTSVVSPAVQTALGAYTSTVTRLAGPSRYDTAAAFSNAVFPTADTVFVAYGGNYPDALVAAAAAGSLSAPVLLVETNSIPTATADELTRLTPETIYVIGGTGVISDSVKNALDAFGDTVTRVAGPTRYATAAAVSSTFFPTATNVWIATGRNYPDALVAAGGAINSGGPVLLVQTNSIPAETVTELSRTSRLEITIVGGTAVVSTAVQNALATYLD